MYRKCKWKLGSLNLFLILYGVTSSIRWAKGEESHSVTAWMYKCSGEDVKEEFLNIPESLKILYPDQKIEYFTRKFNTSTLFNFTLVERTDKKFQCTPNKSGKNEEFILEIPTLVPENNGEETTSSSIESNFNFSPDGFLSYFKGDEEIYFHPENFCVSK